MRILYLSQYYPPEIGATQIRAYEMARGLIEAGHQVTIVTEFPNHPAGIIPPAYRGKVFERQNDEGIEIIRVWVMASPRKSFWPRMAFYLSYMVMAVFAGLLVCRGKYDVVYATSPPLFAGAAGMAISYLRRIPLTFEVRDLWPESATVLGQLSNPRTIRWATWLEERCYKRAIRVVVTSDEILNRLLERGQQAEKLTVIRNGANTDLFFADETRRNLVRDELRMANKFILLYAGLHGLAYDWDSLLTAAKELSSHSEIHFLLVGDGPAKASVVERAARIGLNNVTFLPAQPREKIPGFFDAADVSIVPLRKPQIKGMFPVKIYDSMASSLPVIVCATGEPRTVVEESQAGLATEPGYAQELRAAILQLQADPSLRSRLGANGRRAVEARFSRQAQAKQLANVLEAGLT